MGYALDINLFIDVDKIDLDVSHINRKPIEEIYTAVLSRVEAWMRTTWAHATGHA